MIITQEMLYKNLECELFNKSMVIYMARHIVENKIYIGKTTRKLRKRIMEHLQNCRISYFDRAIKKYGIEYFDISILEECTTEDELNAREKFWIKEFNCKVPNGYNLTDGGEGIVGYIVPPELCKKRSENRKGYKVPKKTCLKISMAKKGKKGKPASKKTRDKMSTSNKNKRAVICIETKQIFPSIRAAANSIKRAACTISIVIGKENYTAGGYHWRYFDDNLKNKN